MTDEEKYDEIHGINSYDPRLLEQPDWWDVATKVCVALAAIFLTATLVVNFMR